MTPRGVKTCGLRFPVLVNERTYYVTCDLAQGHDRDVHPCSGRAHNYGAPRL